MDLLQVGQEGVNINSNERKPIYQSTQEEGVDLTKEVALLRQALYELREKNYLNEQKIAELNSRLDRQATP